MTALTDELRRLALHADLPVCAQAADEIERLRGLVEAGHAQMPDEPDRCECGWVAPCGICAATGWDGDEACECIENDAWADREHAAHVRQILDGGAR